MIMKMRNMMKRKNGQKGFTLVELIVVMAILAILAAIAVPKYTGIQNTAKVKADGSTAMSIIHAARLQDNATGKVVTGIPAPGVPGDNPLKTTYMVVPAPQSGKQELGEGETNVFTLTKTDDIYSVTWSAEVTGYKGTQTITENTMGTWTPHEY